MELTCLIDSPNHSLYLIFSSSTSKHLIKQFWDKIWSNSFLNLMQGKNILPDSCSHQQFLNYLDANPSLARACLNSQKYCISPDPDCQFTLGNEQAISSDFLEKLKNNIMAIWEDYLIAANEKKRRANSRRALYYHNHQKKSKKPDDSNLFQHTNQLSSSGIIANQLLSPSSSVDTHDTEASKATGTDANNLHEDTHEDTVDAFVATLLSSPNSPSLSLVNDSNTDDSNPSLTI